MPAQRLFAGAGGGHRDGERGNYRAVCAVHRRRHAAQPRRAFLNVQGEALPRHRAQMVEEFVAVRNAGGRCRGQRLLADELAVQHLQALAWQKGQQRLAERGVVRREPQPRARTGGENAIADHAGQVHDREAFQHRQVGGFAGLPAQPFQRAPPLFCQRVAALKGAAQRQAGAAEPVALVFALLHISHHFQRGEQAKDLVLVQPKLLGEFCDSENLALHESLEHAQRVLNSANHIVVFGALQRWGASGCPRENAAQRHIRFSIFSQSARNFARPLSVRG